MKINIEYTHHDPDKMWKWKYKCVRPAMSSCPTRGITPMRCNILAGLFFGTASLSRFFISPVQQIETELEILDSTMETLQSLASLDQMQMDQFTNFSFSLSQAVLHYTESLQRALEQENFHITTSHMLHSSANLSKKGLFLVNCLRVISASSSMFPALPINLQINLDLIIKTNQMNQYEKSLEMTTRLIGKVLREAKNKLQSINIIESFKILFGDALSVNIAEWNIRVAADLFVIYTYIDKLDHDLRPFLQDIETALHSIRFIKSIGLPISDYEKECQLIDSVINLKIFSFKKGQSTMNEELSANEDPLIKYWFDKLSKVYKDDEDSLRNCSNEMHLLFGASFKIQNYRKRKELFGQENDEDDFLPERKRTLQNPY